MLSERQNLEANQIENILILDTETGGLDSRLHSLLEIGVIHYNIPTKSILFRGAGLLQAEHNTVPHVNNIDIEACKKVNGDTQDYFYMLLKALVMNSDVIIAHNSQFDKRFMSLSPIGEISEMSKWLCTKKDFMWQSDGLKLENIAHSCGVPYTGAHRALADCDILLECLLSLPDFNEQLINAYNK